MTSNVTAGVVGASIGNAASNSGLGLVEGLYTVAYTTGDPLIFTDFTTLKYVDVAVAGTRPTVLIDSVTANQVNLTGAGLNSGNVTAYCIGIK